MQRVGGCVIFQVLFNQKHMQIFKQSWLLIILVSVVIATGIVVFSKQGEDVAIKVNNRVVTYEEFNQIMENVYRWSQETVKGENLKKEAIKEAVNTALFDEYLERKGITVTDEEIDAKWEEFAVEWGAANKLELISQAEEAGIAESDLYEMVISSAREDKLIELYREEINISEEEIEKEYDDYVSYMEGAESEALSFEEMREEIEERLLYREIGPLYENEMKEIREESNIEVFIELEEMDIEELF